MRGRMFGAVLAVGAILAGCEAGQPKKQESVGAQARLGEDVGKRLATMPEGQRNAVFIRAIRDAGFECQHVETSALAGDHEGVPMWTASCRDEQWAILVAPSGMAQVLSCRQAKEAGLPECAG